MQTLGGVESWVQMIARIAPCAVGTPWGNQGTQNVRRDLPLSSGEPAQPLRPRPAPHGAFHKPVPYVGVAGISTCEDDVADDGSAQDTGRSPTTCRMGQFDPYRTFVGKD